MQASIRFIAPLIFVFTHSNGLYSAVGTIFVAAACTTYSIPDNARCKRSLSRTSPIKKRTRGSLPYSFAIYHRSAEHTSELQSLMRISYAVFCLKKTTGGSRERTHIITTVPTATLARPLQLEENRH